MDLGLFGYTDKGSNIDQVKVILEKCLKKNKYFKVWNMKWKGPSLMPLDLYDGKGAYYRYKE